MTRQTTPSDLDGMRGAWPYRLRWMTERVPDGVLAAPAVAQALAAVEVAVDRAEGVDPSDLAELVDATEAAISACGRALAAAGGGVPPASGTVLQINVSRGGVPKLAVDEAVIGERGLEGDVQGDRRHHGRPIQAVCLWSSEVIDALRAEGHPIEPGAAGENLTVSGLDWAALRPGARLSAGEALLEVTAWAIPCSKNAQWFVDRNFNRIDHDSHPGWSRAYASVLRGGQIRVGDDVVVEPGAF